MVCAELSSCQWLSPAQSAKAEKVNLGSVFCTNHTLSRDLQMVAYAEEVRHFNDGGEGVFPWRPCGVGMDQLHCLHHFK